MILYWLVAGIVRIQSALNFLMNQISNVVIIPIQGPNELKFFTSYSCENIAVGNTVTVDTVQHDRGILHM
jgi:hypothetical protein